MANNLEKKLGHDFADKELLDIACCHPSNSVVHEKKHLGYSFGRLEFLGDAVVGLVLADYIFDAKKQQSEGDLTVWRNHAAAGATLAQLAEDCGIAQYVQIGGGVSLDTGRQKILADFFEAIIGAIYLDGGFEKARVFLLQVMEQNLEAIQVAAKMSNPRGRLQELQHAADGVQPQYSLIELGEEDGGGYEAIVYAGKQELGRGRGNNKQSAAVAAAEQALQLHAEKTRLECAHE